jgi:hypothetical protein
VDLAEPAVAALLPIQDQLAVGRNGAALRRLGAGGEEALFGVRRVGGLAGDLDLQVEVTDLAVPDLEDDVFATGGPVDAVTAVGDHGRPARLSRAGRGDTGDAKADGGAKGKDQEDGEGFTLQGGEYEPHPPFLRPRARPT